MNKRIMKLYTGVALFSGLGLALWRALLLFRYYDPYSDEISASAEPKMTAFGIGVLAVALLLLSSVLVLKKAKFAPFSSVSNQVSVFSASFCGSVFLAAGVILAIYCGKSLFGAEGTVFFRIMQGIAYLSLFGAAAYFLFGASVRRVDSPARKLLSFFPTVFSLAYLVASYVNSKYIFNDSDRILCHVAMVTLMLFFLLETRNTVIAKSGVLRFSASLVAFAVTAAYILPRFVGVAFWEIAPTKEFGFEAVMGGGLFYIFAVIYTMIGAVKPAEAVSEVSDSEAEG